MSVLKFFSAFALISASFRLSSVTTRHISFADVSLARQKTQASFALALRNADSSFRTEICSL
jgi:hypothetical protein